MYLSGNGLISPNAAKISGGTIFVQAVKKLNATHVPLKERYCTIKTARER